jgi:type IV secretory pathway VirB2 component (pilin)
MYTYEGLMDAVWNLVDFLMRIAGLAVVVAIVWFGLRMAMARGEAAKYEDAKKGLKWAIIGAVTIFGVWTIIATIHSFVGALGGQ